MFNFLCPPLFWGVWHCRMWCGGSLPWAHRAVVSGPGSEMLEKSISHAWSCAAHPGRSGGPVCLWALPVLVSLSCSSAASTSVLQGCRRSLCLPAKGFSWAPRKMKGGKDTQGRQKQNQKQHLGDFAAIPLCRTAVAALLGCGTRASSWAGETPGESGEEAECPQGPLERETVSGSQYLKYPQWSGGLVKLGHSGLSHEQSANSVSRTATCAEWTLLNYGDRESVGHLLHFSRRKSCVQSPQLNTMQLTPLLGLWELSPTGKSTKVLWNGNAKLQFCRA